jgi:hypothetical protein
VAIARQQCGKHVSAATDTDATVEGAVFSVRSMQKNMLYEHI